MSNQSGISVSDALASEFPLFVDSDDVAAILAIDHAKEHVTLEHRVPSAGGFDAVRDKLGESAQAKYVALRLPNADEGFAFVQFMPEAAPLSSKMKYASSHATIHRQLGGSSVFTTSIFWTELSEVGHSGLEAHKAHEAAPAPLTEEEQSLKTAAELEHAHGTSGHSVAGQSTLGIDANLRPDAKAAIDSLKTKTNEAAVFAVTTDDSESIELVATVPAAELAAAVGDVSEPRYAVINLDGRHAFAVACPRSASIKQRMLFASTRISFLSYIKGIFDVDTVIETFDPETDLALSALQAELKPATSATETESQTHTLLGQSKPKFERPRPRKRAGASK